MPRRDTILPYDRTAIMVAYDVTDPEQREILHDLSALLREYGSINPVSDEVFAFHILPWVFREPTE